eukprot:evm.model.scf_2314.1 EVM.evm.TU.scf_2314.1   scf_2314:3217-7067(-)
MNVAQVQEQSAAEVRRVWIRMREVIPEDASCEDVLLAAGDEVTASVSAIAAVYASTFGTVTVSGTGEGCVDAGASGTATATAFINVIVDVAVEIAFQGDRRAADGAFSSGFVNAVTAMVASAWAEAFISGCASASNGEAFVLAEQNSFARAVASPIITAYAWAEVGQECGEAALADSEVGADIGAGAGGNEAGSVSNTIVEGTGSADAEGNAGADTVEVSPEEAAEPCTGTQSVCCLKSPEEICHCTLATIERFFKCNAVGLRVGDNGAVLWTETDPNSAAGEFVCSC